MMSFTRSTFILMSAQGIFMISGYVLNVFLARYFGPEMYGVYGVAMAVLVWVELFVITGVPTAMQKFLAESSSAASALVSFGRRMQLGYTLAVFTLFVALVPVISAWLQDATFERLLWIAAPDIVFYGLYWFYLGVHSGLHRFESQALIVVSYAISKVASCVGLVLAGGGIVGAFVGNFLASAIGLFFGLWMLRTVSLSSGPKNASEHYTRITQFAVPIVLYTLSINAILYIDLLFVRRFLPASAAGHYTAAAMVARVPYFVFLGLASTVLPVLSRMLAQESMEASRGLLRQTMRLLFGLLVPVLVLVIANASSIIEFLYTATYGPATQILRLLIVGIALYTFMMVLTTMISADGHPNRAFQISLLCATTDALMCFVLVPKVGTQGGVIATIAASGLGVLMSGAHVLLRFGHILPWQSLIRAALSGMVILAVSLVWTSVGWMLLVKLISLFGFYLFVLYLLGELKGADKVFV